MMKMPGDAFGGLYILLFVAYGVVALIVHIAFASAVYKDAQVRAVKFVSPGMLGLATLVGGVLTAGIYWFIHISSLAPPLPAGDE